MVQQGAPLFASQKDRRHKKLMAAGYTEIKSKYQKARNLYFHMVNLKKLNIISRNFININGISKKLGNA